MNILLQTDLLPLVEDFRQAGADSALEGHGFQQILEEIQAPGQPLAVDSSQAEFSQDDLAEPSDSQQDSTGLINLLVSQGYDREQVSRVVAQCSTADGQVDLERLEALLASCPRQTPPSGETPVWEV